MTDPSRIVFGILPLVPARKSLGQTSTDVHRRSLNTSKAVELLFRPNFFS